MEYMDGRKYGNQIKMISRESKWNREKIGQFFLKKNREIWEFLRKNKVFMRSSMNWLKQFEKFGKVWKESEMFKNFQESADLSG